jgi:nicotinamide riboside kinase
LAARVYAELNRQGAVVAELVREFVKTWAYEGREPDEWDQVFMFVNQLHAEHRLAKAGVKVIVTDSPVLLQCVYATFKNGTTGLHQTKLALRWENAHPSLDFFVERQVAYDPSGRFQTPGALAGIDERIEACLQDWRIHYLKVVPNDWETIIQTVKEAAYSQP